jgi:F5/8 type C domain
MAVTDRVDQRRCRAPLWLLAGAVLLPGVACEPDWDELTNGSGGRPSAAGTGGVAANSGGQSAGGEPSDPGEGGMPPATATDGGAAGEAMAAVGGAGAFGEGGAPPIDDGALDLPGTASADSEESSKGNVAANGHDGNYNTRWVAADGLVGHYWTLDLGSAHKIARVKIHWEYPFGPQPVSYGYTISVSDDDSVFKLVVDKRSNTETSSEQVAELPVGTTARHVRITVTSLPPPAAYDYWASFYEARVYGFSLEP